MGKSLHTLDFVLQKPAQQRPGTSGVDTDSNTDSSLADKEFSLGPAHLIPLLQSIRNCSRVSELFSQLLLLTEHTDKPVHSNLMLE